MTDTTMTQANFSGDYDKAFFDDIEPASLQSAEIVVPILTDLVRPNSVVDVGCGSGAWLSVFKRLGVMKVLGLDGNYVERKSLLIEEDEFVPVDLTMPFPVAGRFDLALCLEVAEHLPAQSAQRFVESLCKLAPVICFSAAVPGQGGIQHLNEQWPVYWEGLFRAAGFVVLDPVRPLIWQDRRVAWYYRQNLLLIARSDVVDTSEVYRTLAGIYANNDMILLRDHVLAYHLSFLPSLRRLPEVFVSALARILNDMLRNRKSNEESLRVMDGQRVPYERKETI